jgi:medium-chain acyl-[acyl-carrier-protein] hydrolase
VAIEHTNFRSNEWLTSSHGGPSRPSARLVCFPYAGAGSFIFETWVPELRNDIELILVRLPGRERRFSEKPFSSMAMLIAELAQASDKSGLMKTQIPVIFFGHCMGALIAFELARYFRSNSARLPTHLIVSGANAPTPSSLVTKPPLHTLSDVNLIAVLSDLAGTPDFLLKRPDLLQLFLPAFRADFALVETYACSDRELLPCKIFCFAGDRDETVSKEGLASWRTRTGQGYVQVGFPGGHFYFHQDEGRRKMLSTIGALCRSA